MKLAIDPEAAGYSVKFGNPVVSTQLEGGAPKTRSDKVGVIHTVTVQWTVDRDKYDYLCAFYRTATQRGALPFTVNLLVDSPDVAEYTAYFVPDSFQLQSQSGLTYVVVATLSVLPLPDDAAADALALGKFDEQLH